ncbi:Uncharacterised protein [Listeria grayi]|uniref:Uncharacterized protein n=1 Tax=Listeria grayi TaxID=1641 RepID=A0A378MFT1_LISGR|nr:hypothetical protein [Listeria grayi]MBC1923175.1 hypothetical protein [Listeria grayi]STY44222.1 Uncharacterised protein [Listeria grayi]VEI35977.1 Uncharacterised protein [Listeria grayi]
MEEFDRSVSKENSEYKNIIDLINLAEKDKKLMGLLKKENISDDTAKKIAIFIYGRLSKI